MPYLIPDIFGQIAPYLSSMSEESHLFSLTEPKLVWYTEGWLKLPSEELGQTILGFSLPCSQSLKISTLTPIMAVYSDCVVFAFLGIALKLRAGFFSLHRIVPASFRFQSIVQNCSHPCQSLMQARSIFRLLNSVTSSCRSLTISVGASTLGGRSGEDGILMWIYQIECTTGSRFAAW
jgi:hypothetical protein